MIKSRNRNIVVKSQFNINGSRGKSVGNFISDYVSRDSATDSSMAYIPDPSHVPVQGDGVGFTLDATAISRDETLRIAEHVEALHQQGNRAIQQMVISFDPDYLVEQGIVPEDAEILNKGDYQYQYDDIRLRHAVRRGMQSLIDNEGYRDGRLIAAIQYDTLHLHVHAVVYENHPKLARMRGHEEKGVIKESSFNQLAYDLDRSLKLTRLNTVPNQKKLLPQKTEHKEIERDIPTDTRYIDMYLLLLQQQEKEQDELVDKIVEDYYDKDYYDKDDQDMNIYDQTPITQPIDEPGYSI